MVRYGVAAIVGCLYVAGSIWLVRSQGESYRESLRRERLASVATEPRAVRPPEEEAKAAPTVTPPEPTLPRTELAPKPVVTSLAPLPAKPAREGSPLAPPSTGLAETKPATAPPADQVAAATAAKVPDPKTGRLNLGPFWEQPVLTKSWDLAHLKTKDEIQLGQGLRDLILQFNRPLETGSWQRRVEEAAEPFLKNRARKDLPYTFTILDSNAVNAFSTPGGFVYVCRGLFNLVGEDEVYALEFVVGHEIAHVELGHALKCLQDPGVMQLPEGTLQKLYMMIIPFGYYPDDLEYVADVWAYRQMRAFGRTDRESLTFLRKLEGHSKDHGFYNGRVKPNPGRDSSPIENHLRAHTAAWKRSKQLKEIIGKP